MKKFMLIALLFVGAAMPVWADTISTDKSDFAEIS